MNYPLLRIEPGRPFVVSERLRQRRKGVSHGRPFSFLILKERKGDCLEGETEGYAEPDDLDVLDLMQSFTSGEATEESRETEIVELEDRRRLGIATLGSLKAASEDRCIPAIYRRLVS